MISVNQVKDLLSEHTGSGKTGTVALIDSLGLVLARNVYSPIDVPSFDNSAMDGYAVFFDDHTREWETEATIQAGDTTARRIKEGKAARIFTGAKIPEGTDTVIPQELIEKKNETTIRYDHQKISSGSNVRLKGSQCRRGDLLLEAGQILGAGQIGLLASVGVDKVEVCLPPSVTFLVTGDELKEPGQALEEGQIYNSNGPMLEALLRETGVQEISAQRIKDDKSSLQQAIEKALSTVDILILSGGISVGDYDYVKECLETAGVEQIFYKVKQRPGKPFYAGKKGSKWIFALPGNPASVHSCFIQYVRPCIKALMGHQQVFAPDHVLPLKEDAKKKPGFTFFMKGKRSDGKVELLSGQQSFNLQAFATANCLVELPEEEDLVKGGNMVNVYDL